MKRQSTTKYKDEILFCAKYLKKYNLLNSEGVQKLDSLISSFTGEFELVRINVGYFEELAKRLIELWPDGLKDNKYPWRESVTNLTARLQLVWTDRKLVPEKYPIERCITVARRYVNQFAENAKYMQTLKNFVMKQEFVGATGTLLQTYKSMFADMLVSTPVGEEDYIAEMVDYGAGGTLV